MCDECQFRGDCSIQDDACRRVLLSGDVKDLTGRMLFLTRDCDCFLSREQRRYA